MTKTISKLYDNYADAERAVSELEAAGVPHSDISLVANNSDNWYDTKKVDRDGDGTDDRAEAAGKGAGIGGGIGVAAGLAAGLGMLAIPGLGPVVAAGWLAAAATGAAAGAATGGVIGALTQAGVSDDDANVYAEGVRRGGTLVTAKVPDADQTKYDAVLQRSSVDIGQRGTAYRDQGWTRFDPALEPYSPDEVTRERQLRSAGR